MLINFIQKESCIFCLWFYHFVFYTFYLSMYHKYLTELFALLNPILFYAINFYNLPLHLCFTVSCFSHTLLWYFIVYLIPFKLIKDSRLSDLRSLFSVARAWYLYWFIRSIQYMGNSTIYFVNFRDLS